MFGVGDFWLGTMTIIKIESHPFYSINFHWFAWGWDFQNRQLSIFFLQNFRDWSLGEYVELMQRLLMWLNWYMVHINALRINLSYLHKDQSLKFLQKILRIGGSENLSFFESAIWIFVFHLIFFASSPWKSVKTYMVEWMGLNFDDYSGFQPKITHPKYFWPECTLKLWAQMIAWIKILLCMYCAVYTLVQNW